MSDTLYEHGEYIGGFQSIGYTTPALWRGQKFDVPIAHTITSIALYLAGISGSNGTFTVSIRESPYTGVDLCVGSIAVSSIPASWGWTEITFSVHPLLAINHTYAIVCRLTSTDAMVGWEYGDYTEGGLYSVNSGQNWTNVNTLSFREYGIVYPLSSKPINPVPANGATGVNFANRTLSWTNGGTATNYDVYMGDASDNLTKVSSSQVAVSYIATPANIALFSGGLCYWRVDAINEAGTTTGDVWHFDARPAKPINPAPTDEETKVDKKTENLVWEDGASNADTFNIYFGTESGSLTQLYTERDVLTPTWTSPMVVLEISDYNPAVNSGYRSPVAGDELSCGDTTYYVYGIKRGDLFNVHYEAKLYAFRVGAPCNAGDELTNGVAPDIENPQAVKVTLNNSWHFHGEVESAYYPYATRYYWRINAVNEAGTTTGDEWYFDIEASLLLNERPSYYDGISDWQWQYYDGSYQWVDIDVAGGGRYKQNLVVIGKDCVYYG